MIKWKIVRTNFRGASPHLDTSVREAVHYTLTPDAYSYEGQFEKLQERCNKQEEMIGHLVEALWESGRISKHRMEEILSSEFALVQDEEKSTVAEGDGD